MTMKNKLLMAGIAASLIAGPALAAPQHGYDNRGGPSRTFHQPAPKAKVVVKKKVVVKQVQPRKWRKGERFDRSRVRTYRQITNPRAYRLREAPRGYRWVQSDRDAVMVAITTGLIASVVANAF